MPVLDWGLRVFPCSDCTVSVMWEQSYSRITWGSILQTRTLVGEAFAPAAALLQRWWLWRPHSRDSTKNCLWKRSWVTLGKFHTLSPLCVLPNSLIHSTFIRVCCGIKTVLGTRNRKEWGKVQRRLWQTHGLRIQIHLPLLPPWQNTHFVWDGNVPGWILVFRTSSVTSAGH